MITEAILNFLFGIAERSFSTLPDIYISVDTSAFEYVRGFIAMISYLLPLDTVRAIVAALLALTVFRIVIAIARTVMGLIPFV